MGIENNEAVIATTSNHMCLENIEKWVIKQNHKYRKLFAFIPGLVNNEVTIILAPCGSKKGWTEDEEVKILRNKFIQKIESFNLDDGSSLFKYIEVGFGDFGQKVLRGNCKNKFSNKEYEG